MKCSEIITLLEQEYGKEYACDWDNVGLLAGRRDKEVKKILLALDATDEVVGQAAEGAYDMLITHHPMIFGAIKRVTDEDMVGRRLLSLIRSDISYYAMHTNYDTRGMADLTARLLNLQECTVLEEVKDGEGIGRVGVLPEEMTLRECAELVKRAYDIPNVKIFGNLDQKVHLAALCPGAGKSTMHNALQFGCDVYITGDIDHHTGIDAAARGLSILDAGHYGLEHIFVTYMAEYFKERLPELNIYSQKLQSPFSYIV